MKDFQQSASYKSLKRAVGKAIADFAMIDDGDKVAVGLSGGKDSYTLLSVLGDLQRRAPISYRIKAFTVDAGYDGFRSDIISKFCIDNNFEHEVISTTHYDIIKDKLRPGSSICALCSRLKRGTLYSVMREQGFNKLALGHHRDDFVETLLLNQFFVGTLKAMSASMLADTKDITVIRPLVYVAEKDTINFAKQLHIPVVSCSCPVAGSPDLQRQRMKELLDQLEGKIPNIRNSLLASLSNVEPRHLLDKNIVKSFDKQIC